MKQSEENWEMRIPADLAFVAFIVSRNPRDTRRRGRLCARKRLATARIDRVG